MKLAAFIFILVASSGICEAQQPWIVRQTRIPAPVRQYLVPYTTQPTLRNVQYERPSGVPFAAPRSFGSAVSSYANWSWRAGRATIQAGDGLSQMYRSRHTTGRWWPY